MFTDVTWRKIGILLLTSLVFAAFILVKHINLIPSQQEISRSPSTVSAIEPREIDHQVAGQCLDREAAQLRGLDQRLVLNPAVRRFIAEPTFQFTQTSFTDGEMASQKIDLVLICDQRLRLLMGLAYDETLQSPTTLDPEVKLGLINHPIFTQRGSPSMALVKTHRGTMLLVYEKIRSTRSTAAAAVLILGRILSPQVLGGGHLEALPVSPATDQDRWPDLFGKPVFAIN